MVAEDDQDGLAAGVVVKNRAPLLELLADEFRLAVAHPLGDQCRVVGQHVATQHDDVRVFARRQAHQTDVVIFAPVQV